MYFTLFLYYFVYNGKARFVVRIYQLSRLWQSVTTCEHIREIREIMFYFSSNYYRISKYFPCFVLASCCNRQKADAKFQTGFITVSFSSSLKNQITTSRPGPLYISRLKNGFRSEDLKRSVWKQDCFSRLIQSVSNNMSIKGKSLLIYNNLII